MRKFAERWGEGTLVDGRFLLESELGRGAHSVVYRAHQASLDRTVAVKVIRRSGRRHSASIKRALREARLVAEVVHPNIVTVYDCGCMDGHAYIVMEHVPGRSLESLLHERIRLPPPVALDLFRQLAGALQAAHESGVVHRDVKPANVLLTERSDGGLRAKLTDFGVAITSTSRITHEGVVLGTPAYMPPEQARGLPVDGRADIYGLGVLMFRCLTGNTPFLGDDAVAMAVQHITMPIPQFREACPEVRCPELEAITRRCLAKHPRDRYATAQDLLTNLQKVELARSAEWVSDLMNPIREVTAPWLRSLRHAIRGIAIAEESRRYLAAGLLVGLAASMLTAVTLGVAEADSAPVTQDTGACEDPIDKTPEFDLACDRADEDGPAPH